MILAKYFEKKNIPIFFLRIFQKMCRSIYFRELKQLKKIIQQFSRYGPKKKSGPTTPSHPIHPIPSHHPSIKIGGGAWYPVAEVKRQHNDIPVGRLLFRIPFYLSFLFFSLPCLALPAFLFTFLFFFFFPIKIPLKFYKGVPSLMY